MELFNKKSEFFWGEVYETSMPLIRILKHFKTGHQFFLEIESEHVMYGTQVQADMHVKIGMKWKIDGMFAKLATFSSRQTSILQEADQQWPPGAGCFVGWGEVPPVITSTTSHFFKERPVG